MEKIHTSSLVKAIIIGAQCLVFTGMMGVVVLFMIALTPAGMA